MHKRVFIIHGWSGYPEEGWFPWLKTELEKRGFEVQVPAMPDADEPMIEKWVPFLAQQVGVPDEHTYLVGHSIGGQTILRYLEGLSEEQKVGGVVFVAGWFTLMNQDEEEKRIGKPWIETPIDFEKVKQRTRNFFAVFSDDDEFVPLENKHMFEEKLGAQTILEHEKGHFSGEDEVKELPSVLENILKIKE